MANKRTLKKGINIICEELLTETVAASLYGNDKTCKDNAEALLFTIVKTQRDFISRMSHPEPGMPQKNYFKLMRQQFAAQASELADQISNL